MKVKLGPLHFDGSNKKGIRLFDWLLIIGLSLAPMTGLRIWKVGPAELLCLLWGLKHIAGLKLKLTSTFRFFAAFLIALAIGSVIGFVVARNELRLTDFLTWIFLALIAVSMHEGLGKNTPEYNEKLFYAFACTALLVQVFLYVYSLYVSKEFFGAPLWYHDVRYSGGAENPHQVAVMATGVLFVFLHRALRYERFLVNLAFAGAAMFILLQTTSSTGIMAVAVGAASLVYFRIATISSKRMRFPYMLLLTIAIGLITVVFYEKIKTFIIEWIRDDANGEGRIEIFSSIGTAFLKSPFFGLGPGVHGIDGTIEFHNAYLEIIAATGIVGVIVFTLYTVRIVKDIWRADWTLMPILVSVYAYSASGFAMRRLVYWGVLLFAVVIAEGRNREGESCTYLLPSGRADR